MSIITIVFHIIMQHSHFQVVGGSRLRSRGYAELSATCGIISTCSAVLEIRVHRINTIHHHSKIGNRGRWAEELPPYTSSILCIVILHPMYTSSFWVFCLGSIQWPLQLQKRPLSLSLTISLLQVIDAVNLLLCFLVCFLLNLPTRHSPYVFAVAIIERERERYHSDHTIGV